MPISDRAKAYKSYDGRWMLFGDGLGFGHRDVYFSPDDGKTFYQLDQTGWGNGHMSYFDPHHQTKIDLRKHQEEDFIREVTAIGPGRIYRPQNLPADYEVVLLPHVRQMQYFFALNDGNLIYVSIDIYYRSLPPNVYFGKPDAMMKQKIKTANHLKISTESGLLEVGGCFPLWEGLQVFPIKAERFFVTETDSDLTIRLRH